MKRTMTALTLLATTRLLTACGPATGEEPLADSSDDVKTQSQALYESCTDSGVSLVQPNGAALTLNYPNCSYADTAATSQDSTYDQSLCPNKFVTEIQQVYGRGVTPFVEVVPASTVTTQSACESVAITGYAWGYNGSSWVSLGSVSTAGVWHPAWCGSLFCMPASCQLSFDIGGNVGGYSKVRVAGFGAAFGVFKTRVKTGVHSGGGPC